MKILAFLLISSVASAQTLIGIDTLMLSNGIQTKTQLTCDSNGENCIPQIVLDYDNEGRLTLKKTYKGDTLVETNRYTYNQHNLAEKVYTAYGGGAEFLNIKYGYDAKNQLVSFDACYGGGRCEPFEKYKYRQDGKLISRTRYREGKYFYEYRHKYDARGNNIEILILSNDSDSGERERKTFNSKGQHIASKWIDYRGEEIDNAEYTYDSAGRLLKNEWVGGLSTKKLYEYDSLGNNIKYTSIDYNNQVDDLREMTFEDKLIQSRIQYEGKKVVNYLKFDYIKR
jgi:hypothetical protein